MNLPSLDSVNYTIALLTILGVPLAVWRSKSRKRITAAADAILGEEAVVDRDGKVITPGQPGLVHRVTSVEEAVVEFRHMVGLLTEVQGRLDRHDDRLRVLELASVERIVTKAEAAAAWQAVADRDLVDGE